MPQHRHVLFIVLDTLRRDRLSAYGHPQRTSPQFDAFSQRGTLFERAIAPAQWTMPSHASMFTGVYPTTHQLIEAFGQLDNQYATLPQILQVAGYHTVAFCNNPLVGLVDNGLQRGFDAFYNYCGASPNSPYDVARLPGQRAITARFRRFARYVSNQFTSNYPLFHLMLKPALANIWQQFINYKGNTERSIGDLVRYWEHHHKQNDKPLFAFVNLMGGHTPYHPPAHSLKHIRSDLQYDRAAHRWMHRFNVDVARWASPTIPPLTEWETQVADAFYQAEVHHQDEQLGRLLHLLEKSGSFEDTLVVILADHGEGHGDHGFFGHSFVVYQELVHVPLALYHPDYPEGGRVRENISTRRLYHTILDYTGVQPPLAEDDPNADIHGLSLARLLAGGHDIENSTAFAEGYPPRTFLSVLERFKPHLIEQLHLHSIRRAIYQGDHKLTVTGDTPDGLFNVAADLQDAHDLSAQHPDLADRLQSELNRFVEGAQAQRFGMGVGEAISPEVADNLRALGYFE